MHDLNSGDEVADHAADDVTDDNDCSSAVVCTTEQTLSKQHIQTLAQQAQYHPQNSMNQNLQSTDFMHNQQCVPPPQMPEIVHNQQSSTIAQHILDFGGRLHAMPSTPAKYCAECGAIYLRETSKYCSECGAKRLGDLNLQ